MPESDLDPLLLERYVAGETTPAERVWLEREVAFRPAYRAQVERVRSVWAATLGTLPSVDIDTAWRQSQARLSAVHLARRHVWSRAFNPWIATAFGVALIMGLSLSLGGVMSRRSPKEPFRTLATAAGNRATITLRDGTQLVLGPASHIRIPADFGAGKRTVELDGQALFMVVHDAAHPFTVQTARAVVRDVGTTFTIQAYPGDAEERVAVAEGEVSLGQTVLGARDVAVIDQTGAALVQRDRDVSAYFAWAQGHLIFTAAPVRDVMREVARSFDLDITFADSAVAHNAITASFDHESADEVLKEITQAIGGQYERRGRHVVISSGRKISTPGRLQPAVLNIAQVKSDPPSYRSTP